MVVDGAVTAGAVGDTEPGAGAPGRELDRPAWVGDIHDAEVTGAAPLAVGYGQEGQGAVRPHRHVQLVHAARAGADETERRGVARVGDIDEGQAGRLVAGGGAALNADGQHVTGEGGGL